MGARLALIQGFAGTTYRPGDEGYEEARAIWNGAITKRPSLIARCTSTADVVAALRWGRDNGLEISVRGGGHGVAGNALTDGGLEIDLSQMTAIDVDASERRARVSPGALLGDLSRETARFGLTVPSGIVSHTGVAGLTLGGGIGWLMRKHGLTCDHLVWTEVVTASGEIVRVDAASDPELMWGLRGGGGNFGIVTSFEFNCVTEDPTVLAGPMLFAAEEASEILPAYREAAAAAPRELTTISLLRYAPPAPWVPDHLHGRPVIVMGVCYAGAHEDGEKAIAPLRALGEPLLDLIGPRDLTEYMHLFDPSVPHGLGYYWKSQYLRDLSPDAIDPLISKAWEIESKRSYTIMFQMGGAVQDVEPDATAFEDRTAAFTPNINAVWDDLSQPKDVEWARELFDALTPASTGRSYVNFMSNDDQDRVTAAYGDAKVARLRALKDRMDPDNVFSLNQNIPPSKG